MTTVGHENIQVDAGLKRITINGDPERVITFNPLDTLFVERYFDMLQKFEEKMVEYKEQCRVFEANTEKDENGIPGNARQQIAMLREVCEFVRENIDRVFGENTSQKVFGDVLSLGMFGQFFKEIAPHIQSARAEKMSQYQKKAGNRKK